MSRWTRRDSQEFADYLRGLTDAQVAGALEKERDARRAACVRLAELEAARRGLL